MTPPTPPAIHADLHNHTTCSDGELSPRELVAAARDRGIPVIAVTDHDTIEGVAEAVASGKEFGVTVVCGVEATVRFVTVLFRGSLHLLIYFPEPLLQDEAFVRGITDLLAMGRGEALTTARIEAINREFGPCGVNPMLARPLTESDVYRHGHRISRRHFALALNDLGITDTAQVSTILGNDSPAYIPSGIPIEPIGPFLKRWPVVAVLAHPAAGSFPGESHYKEVLPPIEVVEQLLPEFLAIGIEGLEIPYPGHTIELQERLRQIMTEKGLRVVTGGSDCHDRTGRPLGVAGITEAEYEVLRKRLSAGVP